MHCQVDIQPTTPEFFFCGIFSGGVEFSKLDGVPRVCNYEKLISAFTEANALFRFCENSSTFLLKSCLQTENDKTRQHTDL